jgi:hypothetical protein
MNYIGKELGDIFKGVSIPIDALYDFTDLWHNLSYLAGFLKIVPAFILIMAVCNEYSYKTVRQNIMDGMSRMEWLKSKWTMVLFLSLASTLFLFVLGLILGFLYSPVQGIEYIFFNIEMLFGHFLVLCTYLSIALLVALLIKKSGFSIAILILYGQIVEPIILQIYKNDLGFLKDLFPFEALSNIVRFPFAKYVFMETQNYIDLKDALIVVGYLIVINGLSVLLVKKKDF